MKFLIAGLGSIGRRHFRNLIALGATVGECLADLIRIHPGLGSKLFDNGQLRPYVNVTVNDEDIRFLDDLATPVADGQMIDLIPAVAGG